MASGGRVLISVACALLPFGQSTQTVVGSVVDQAGRPVVGAEIIASVAGVEGARTTTSVDGSFKIELGAKYWRLTVQAPSHEGDYKFVDLTFGGSPPKEGMGLIRSRGQVS